MVDPIVKQGSSPLSAAEVSDWLERHPGNVVPLASCGGSTRIREIPERPANIVGKPGLETGSLEEPRTDVLR